MISSSWKLLHGRFDDFVFIRNEAYGPDSFSPTSLVGLARDSDAEEQCSIDLNLRRARAGEKVRGFHLVSEAKIVEVFNAVDGYCGTAKATLESNDDEIKLYRVEFNFDDTAYTNISLKLLSLVEKDRVWIRELVVYVVDDSKEERSGHSGLDVGTVRSMLGGLGKPLTSRAEELLSSVEQYQDMVSNGIEDMHSVFSQVPGLDAGRLLESLGKGKCDRNGGDGADVLSPLLSIFGQIQPRVEIEAKGDTEGKECDIDDCKSVDLRKGEEDLESRLKGYIDQKFSDLETCLVKRLDRLENLLLKQFREEE